MEHLIDGAVLAVAIALMLTATGKVVAIARGQLEVYGWAGELVGLPVAYVVGAAAAAECVAATTLIAFPIVGGVSVGVLLLIYSVALARLPANAPCGCLGHLDLHRSARAAIVRNMGVILILLPSMLWADPSGVRSWQAIAGVSVIYACMGGYRFAVLLTNSTAYLYPILQKGVGHGDDS